MSIGPTLTDSPVVIGIDANDYSRTRRHGGSTSGCDAGHCCAAPTPVAVLTEAGRPDRGGGATLSHLASLTSDDGPAGMAWPPVMTIGGMSYASFGWIQLPSTLLHDDSAFGALRACGCSPRDASPTGSRLSPRLTSSSMVWATLERTANGDNPKLEPKWLRIYLLTMSEHTPPAIEYKLGCQLTKIN